MQKIFGTYTKLVCSFSILLSIALMQLPEQTAHYSEHSLDRWVEEHLHAGDAAEPNSGAEAIYKNIALIETKSAAESGEQQQHENLVPYLLIAWTQHQGASDMAGVYVQERMLTHIIQKYTNGPYSLVKYAASTAHSTFKGLSKGIYDVAFEILSLAQIPGLSGTCINAP